MILNNDNNQDKNELKLEPIKKLMVIDLIIDRIGKLIAEGTLKPGTYLPSERKLAETLRVSRTSVRQALKALDVLGILEIKAGTKTYLTKSLSRILINPIRFMVLLHNIDYFELFETRKVIECSLVKFAAKNISEEDIGKLEENLIESELNIGDNKKFIDYNTDFHQIIYYSSGLNILPAFMKSIRNLIIATGEKTSGKIIYPKLCLEQHKKIFYAIKQRDKDKASEEMFKHLDSVESKIMEYGKI